MTHDPRCCSLRLLTEQGGSTLVNHANRAPSGLIDQHPEVLCEALCIMGRFARLSDPLPPRQRSAGRRVAAEFGSGQARGGRIWAWHR
jgi:hypothetical protein